MLLSFEAHRQKVEYTRFSQIWHKADFMERQGKNKFILIISHNWLTG